MTTDTVYISSNGASIISVKLTIKATASGFEVDSELRMGGLAPRVTHIDVFGNRPLAVAAMKTEAARITAGFLNGEI